MKYLKYLLFIIFLIPFNIYALEINSKNAILYNLNDDKVLYSKNENEKTAIASLTKIMTTIVAIENIDNINEYVLIPKEAFEGLIESDASVAGFKPNQKVTYKDLLYGVLLPSGADATKTLALKICGSEKEFVKLMNKKAKELNMVNTNFVNTSGLDIDNHYSTVKDLSILLKYSLKNELFKKIYTANKYTTSDKSLTFYSAFSKYLYKYNIKNKYIKGTKTGFTDNAGYCLSSIASYNGINFLLITTNADGKSNLPLHIMDANLIYDYYINNYQYLNLNKQLKIKTKNAKQKEYIVNINTKHYLNKNIKNEDIKYNYEGLNKISFFNKKEKIGTLTISLNNEILEIIDINYNGELNFSFIKFIFNYWYILIILLFIFKKVKKRKS